MSVDPLEPFVDDDEEENDEQMSQSKAQAKSKQVGNNNNHTRPCVRWGYTEDQALISALNDLMDYGRWKADNDQFKSGAYVKLEILMEQKLPRCGMKAKPHIESRVKLLRNQFNIIAEMLGPNANRATGESVEGPKDAIERIDEEERGGQQEQDVTPIDLEEINIMDEHPIISENSIMLECSTPPITPPGSRNTKRARIETIEALKEYSTKIDKMSDVMQNAVDHIWRLANYFQHESDSANRRLQVTDEVMKIEGLTHEEVIIASRKIALNPLEVDFFFTLPEDYRTTYVRSLLV
ncbi:hypothetical protein Cni_G22859 [Canna indica]|uniref:Myb/SANT-like domain-containing protein n=1 Tax=Canna indica TaxID=4628 RepID=A0AAQ3KSK1_9LILI|nr:hypothetical protein Cni_G22859 [Canna indica]